MPAPEHGTQLTLLSLSSAGACSGESGINTTGGRRTTASPGTDDDEEEGIVFR